jgi:Transcriptional regulator, AbiEi antitoxin, Type IV TA system
MVCSRNREHRFIVNTAIRTPVGVELEQDLAAKLEELLHSISWLQKWRVRRIADHADKGWDLEATLPLQGNKVILGIQCKAELRPSTFHAFAESKSPSLRNSKLVFPVLAMPFISPRIAELCVEYGWGWYDLAGNCHIDIPNAIYLERTGREPIHARPRPKANLSTPEAARVIRALLAIENAGNRWTQRSMENHFGQLDKPVPEPSLGLVNKIVKHLRDEAFIEVFPDGGFRLRDPVKLLFAWRDAYRFDRHERRNYFTLLQGKRLRDAFAKLESEAGGFAAYAAFSAADFQSPHVRQPKTWIYVSGDYIKRMEELLEAKRVESGDNVVVMIPEDAGVFYLGDGGTMGEHRMACTNPVQTYVDLFHCGGRGKEAAEALLEQKLKPEWRQQGLS